MAIPFQDLLKELSEEEQQAIADGTRQLSDEYLAPFNKGEPDSILMPGES